MDLLNTPCRHNLQCRDSGYVGELLQLGRLIIRSCVSRLSLKPLMLILFTVACGSPKAALTSKKQASAGDAGSGGPALVALGDNCKETNIATSIAGFDARIALVVSNATEQTHSIGFVGQVPNLQLNFQEAVLKSPKTGSFSVEVLLRDIKACEEARVNGSSAVCQLAHGPAQAAEIFDIKQKISFIVTATVGQYIQTGSLGTGQKGFISDAVNGEGLIGFLGKTGILQSAGGGGLGGLGGLIGVSEAANQRLAAAQAQENKPKAGCSPEVQNSAAAETTGVSPTSTPVTP